MCKKKCILVHQVIDWWFFFVSNVFIVDGAQHSMTQNYNSVGDGILDKSCAKSTSDFHLAIKHHQILQSIVIIASITSGINFLGGHLDVRWNSQVYKLLHKLGGQSSTTHLQDINITLQRGGLIYKSIYYHSNPTCTTSASCANDLISSTTKFGCKIWLSLPPTQYQSRTPHVTTSLPYSNVEHRICS